MASRSGVQRLHPAVGDGAHDDQQPDQSEGDPNHREGRAVDRGRRSLEQELSPRSGPRPDKDDQVRLPSARTPRTEPGRARMRLAHWLRSTAVVAVGAAVVAGALPAAAAEPTTLKGISTKEARAVAEGYAEVVEAHYDASIASAQQLQTAINAFVAEPHRGNPRSGEAGVAHRPRRLPPHRGLPPLRGADRRRRDRARGSDQRVAHGRGLRRRCRR